MQPLLAELTAELAVKDSRGATRRTLKLEVVSSVAHGTARALILNLSQTGLLIETGVEVEVGQLVSLELPEAGLVWARITRSTGTTFGCEFLEPVSKAAVSAALLLAPAEPAVAAPQQLASAARTHPADEWADEYSSAETSPLERTIAVVALAIVAAATALFIFALAKSPFAMIGG